MKKFTPEVQMWPIEDVKPYEKNPKIHTMSQVEDIAKVIKAQGWDVPIVVDAEGVIIKGHGRRLAALHLNLKQVPVIVRRDLSPKQTQAARLSDNRVAVGEIDTEMLREELQSLADAEDLDVKELGFSEKELDLMLGEIDKMNEDAFSDEELETPAPASVEPPTSTVSEPDEAGKKSNTITIGDALGFKSLPAESQRDVVKFMAFAEAETGETGASAFVKMCKSVVTERETR